jgi:hypothetical protein
MNTPFDTLPPAEVVLHATPSTLAVITRVPVLVGPVVPLLLLLLPHAAETRRTDIAIATRRCIARSLRGFHADTYSHCAVSGGKPSRRARTADGRRKTTKDLLMTPAGPSLCSA